jgi:hypothetical protein
VKAIYKGSATEGEYTRYNNLFHVWHNEIAGAGSEIEEDEVRKYIQLQAGDTRMLVAALKFRFNFCEKRDFDFKKLIKST